MSHGAKRVRYVLKRLLQAVPVILAILVVNFFLLQLAEGDAVDVLAGEAGSATPEYMAQLREKFGLDKPLPVQLVIYLKNVGVNDIYCSWFWHCIGLVCRIGFKYLARQRHIHFCIDYLCNAVVLDWFNDDRCVLAQAKLVPNQRHGERSDVL